MQSMPFCLVRADGLTRAAPTPLEWGGNVRDVSSASSNSRELLSVVSVISKKRSEFETACLASQARPLVGSRGVNAGKRRSTCHTRLRKKLVLRVPK